MKKFVSAGMLAFCLIAMSQQEASAWVNSKFGIGLNWDWQSGGNSFFWGVWRNGQPPGPEAFGAGPGPGYGGPGYGGPGFGAGVGGGFGGAQSYPQPTMAQPSFQSPPPAVMPQGAFQAPYVNPAIAGSMYQASPFQFANYPRQVEYYYYPNTWYGNR